MNSVLYISSLCSTFVERKLLIKRPKIIGLQIQKYHRLMTKGLFNNGLKVTALSYHPGLADININGDDKEIENGVEYKYIETNEKNLFRHLLIAIKSYKFTKKFLKVHRDAVVICDVLNFSIAFGAIIASKKIKRECVGIITDFPDYLFGPHSFRSFLSWKIINMCTSYVVLTKQMSERLKKKKKYVVVEGLVDSSIKREKNTLKGKTKPIRCIYAGMLHKKWGIASLVSAFQKARISNCVLDIYGDGDYANEIKKINDSCIKYHGIVSNDEVVKSEMSATLLINPRPSNEEFTKYSFPSKNMEYMASGTPLLTTRLPGMPAEYNKYVYLFDDETIDGMARTLKLVLSENDKSLFQKGKEAQSFVINNKSETIQTKKIIDMIDEGLNK